MTFCAACPENLTNWTCALKPVLLAKWLVSLTSVREVPGTIPTGSRFFCAGTHGIGYSWPGMRVKCIQYTVGSVLLGIRHTDQPFFSKSLDKLLISTGFSPKSLDITRKTHMYPRNGTTRLKNLLFCQEMCKMGQKNHCKLSLISEEAVQTVAKRSM